MTAKTQIETIIITEDELLRLGAEDKAFEVVNGELVEMSPVGYQHSELVFHIAKILDRFSEEQRLGYVHPDGLLYVLQKTPEGDFA